MIIKVEQTVSNLKNKFEVKINNELRYLGGTPWMNINVPLDIDKVRKCVITTLDGNLCFVTSYDVLENVSNTAIPMKWAFTGEQKSFIFNIYNNENNICGKFYKLTNGFLDTKYVIEYKNYILKSYDVSIGKTRNISIYDETHQIAEIVKPMHSSNNLDYYYIFLLDEFSELETILSFFTIYFDYQNYSNSGEIAVSKKEVNVRYTWGKNNKFYDKAWIKNHFTQSDVELIAKKMLEDGEKTASSIKKQANIILSIIAIVWLIVLVIALIVFIIYFS